MPENKTGPGREATVSLREITRDTVRSILKLEVSENQKRFVAPNAYSISEAYFEPKAWMRAVYADEIPVGFAMLYINPEKPIYYLWRFMIDASYQGFGFGYRAMELIIEYLKTHHPDAEAFLLSYVPEDGGPQPFYQKIGFVDTGVMHGDEMEMQLLLK